MKRIPTVTIVLVLAFFNKGQLSVAQSTNIADFDANGVVEFGDFILFAQAFGTNETDFDLDGSGNVDFPDFVLFAKRFGEGTPRKDISIVLPGGATLDMRWIHSGMFLMGSPVSEPGRNEDEGPRHRVTITKGFYLGRFEVTQQQWESVMNTRPWHRRGESQDPRRANFPASYMGWEDVENFIRKLNEVEGKPIYRLPTEAEWEYSCRAGTATRWSFGDDEGRLGDYARYYENSRSVIVLADGRTVYGSREAQETGGVFPNPWGLYDMHGNVAEWVQDYLGPYTAQTKLDPKGPDEPVQDGPPEYNHVVRGGTYMDYGQALRSAARWRGWAGSIRIGFRLLREHR